MDPTESKIANLLLSGQMLDQFQYQAARDHQSQYGGRFHRVVVELGYVHEEKVAKAVSRVTGFPVVLLRDKRKDQVAVDSLPALFCEERLVYPCDLREGGSTLRLAMADPTDIKTRSEAQVRSGLRIVPVVAIPSEIREAIRRDYGLGEPEEMQYAVGSIDLSLRDDELQEGEFKVTDMSGNTAVRHIGDIREESGQEPPEPAPPAPASVVPPEVQARLDKLIQNQEKGERIIKGLYRLCVEKGFFAADEFQEKLKED